MTRVRAEDRLGRLLAGGSVLAALVILVVGVPVVLAIVVGWPLPRDIPNASGLGAGFAHWTVLERTLVNVLACIAWVAWAAGAVSIVAEFVAALRGRVAVRIPLASVFQPVAARLVASLFVAVLGLGRGVSVAAEASQPVSIQQVATGNSAEGDPAVIPAELSPTQGSWTTDSPPVESNVSRSYRVVEGDTLWSIAQSQLGNPLDWPALYTLNEGRAQADGRSLSDPNLIYPGWTLLLPSPSASVAPVTPSPPATTSPAPAPAAPVAPATGTSVAPEAASASPTSTPVTARRGKAPGVRLPSGSVVAESFAAGVLSALAAGRLRRRRRYRPGQPHVEQIGSDPPSGGVRDLLVALRSESHDADEEFTSMVAVDEPGPMTVQPEADVLLHPDVVEVASRGAEVVKLALCEWPGLTMSGPGAASALRAWLSALVARNGPYGAEIITVGPLRGQLFGGLALPNVFEVERTENALSRLETAVATRGALLDEVGALDVATYRAQAPEDPLPLLLVVTDVVPTALRARWQSVMDAATRLGLGAVIVVPAHATDVPLGPHPRMVVSDGGELLDATPAQLAERVAGSQLFLLDATDAFDLLAPIAAIYNDTDDVEGELPDAGAADTGNTAIANNSDTEPATGRDLEAGTPAPTQDAGVRPESEIFTIRSSRWPARREGGDEAPIRVVLLGPAEVHAWGERVARGLRSSAYELLAWYALHPEGASAEAAIDALWPDASRQRGRERFWTALGNLRSRLRGTGSGGTEILVKVGEHYRPDATVLDIDLWRFETALVGAADADEGSDVLAALRSASAAYGGDFSPSDGLWVEPVREDLHRRALDVLIRLAEIEAEAGRSEAALAALERSIELDSICEDAYRRLITLQTRLERPDAAQRTWVLLQGRLAELDLEPEAATTRLVHEALPRRPTHGGPERRPRPGRR